MRVNSGAQLGREYLNTSKLDLCVNSMKAYLSTIFEEGNNLNAISLFYSAICFSPSSFCRVLTMSDGGLSISKSVGGTTE